MKPAAPKPDAPLTERQINERIDRMLLDPRNASATKEQRAALDELTATPDYRQLAGLVDSTREIHRHILTQLTTAWLSRGAGIPITGRQRTALANEAWNIMLASSLYVRDRIAGDELTQEQAEAVLAAAAEADAAADSAASSPVDGLTMPGANLTVSDGGLVDPDPAAASPRPVFDATGQLATANPEE